VWTIEARMHRFMLPEFNTHRFFSRNSESSRAVPWRLRREKVLDSPALPVKWAAEQKGMQGGDEVDDTQAAVDAWLYARDAAVEQATALAELGVHKSLCNRLVEPFMYHVVTFTTTELDGFFKQRSTRFSPLAQPEIAAVADDVLAATEAFEPIELLAGRWHLPYVRDDEMGEQQDTLRKVSTARCARTSYLTHAGVRDFEADLTLHDRLFGADPQHASPFEQVCTPADWNQLTVTLDPADYGMEGDPRTIGPVPQIGNLVGWLQYRHLMLGW